MEGILKIVMSLLFDSILNPEFKAGSHIWHKFYDKKNEYDVNKILCCKL